MNQEIKESIKELEILITALDGTERGEEHNAYTVKCIKNVIDYITNLQQENETFKARQKIGITCGLCPYYKNRKYQ